MEIQYYNKNDMNIAVESNKPSFLSDLLSWHTTYLSNDIFILNYDNQNLELKMQIYFGTEFSECTLKVNTLDLNSECKPLKDKCKTIKLNSNDLLSFLENLGTYLDLVNDGHDNFNPVSQQVNEKQEIKSTTYEWNPYIYLNIKKNYSFDLNNLKRNSFQYYETNTFDCQNLNITKEHIIDVICQELKKLDNNELYTVITYDNLFEFDIMFKNFKSISLISSLEENNLEGIKMNIKLNANLYPFYPPSISFKNKLDNNLEFIINKLSYFNPKNWNPTNSLENMLTQIYSILDKHANIKTIISEDFEKVESLIQNIISTKNIKITSIKEWDDIKIDYIHLNERTSSKGGDSKFWSSGVGYGTKGRNDWDIKKYVQEIKVKTDQELELVKAINEQINKTKDNEQFQTYITNSNLLDVLIDYVGMFNIVEIDNQHKFMTFSHIISILENLDLLNWDNILEYELSVIAQSIEQFWSEVNSYQKLNSEISQERKELFEKINTFYESIKKYNIKPNEEGDSNDYCKIMNEFQLDECKFDKYYYHAENESSHTRPTDMCCKKIQRELATYINSLPMNYESSVYVRYDPNNIRNIKALIVGPKDTPYENGCYIFDIFIPNNYPNAPPKVNLQTTGGGSVRFNPNLYNSGKVCLSLLGTWSGNGGEKWNADTSTLLQVLVSIQSLILVENPYFNEPGYERDMHTDRGKRMNFEYNDRRRLWNIMWAINDNLEKPCIEFKDVIQNHFKLKKNDVINTVNNWYSETTDKNRFNTTKNKCINLLNEL